MRREDIFALVAKLHIDEPGREFKVTSRKWRLTLWILLTIVMLDFALRGFQEPWSFGYFQYALTWENGYMPRGFVGTVLHFLIGDGYYQTGVLRGIMLAVAFAFLAYLIFTAYRLVAEAGNLTGALLMAVFSTSFFCMFYLAETGFLDHIVYLLAVLHIELSLKYSLKVSVCSGALLSMLSVVILSTSAFIICPIIGSVCLLKLVEEKGEEPLTILGKKILRVAVAFIPVLFVILVVNEIQVKREVLEQWLEQAKRFPFYTPDFPNLMAFFYPDGTTKTFWGTTWLYFEPHVLTYILLVIGIMILFLHLIRAKTRVIIGYAVLGLASSVCAYATMYFGGSDSHRYYFAAFMSAFLITLYVLIKYRQKYIPWRLGMVIFAAAILIASPVASYRLWRWENVYKSSPLLKVLNIFFQWISS